MHTFKTLLGVFISFLIESSSFYASATENSTRTWIISGEELRDAIQGKFDNAYLSRNSNRQQAFVDGYIYSLIDSKDWCFTAKVLPHELKDFVFEYLNSLDELRLSQNAGTLTYEAFETYCVKY